MIADAVLGRCTHLHGSCSYVQTTPRHIVGCELLFVVEVRHAQRSLTKVLDKGGSYSLIKTVFGDHATSRFMATLTSYIRNK